MQTVTLYTKLDCSLCNNAYKILLAVAFEIPLEIDVVDITHLHHNLHANYATRIPVVALTNGDELDWPFSAQDVKSRLATQ